MEGRALIKERDSHHHVVVVIAPPGRLVATTTACAAGALARRPHDRAAAEADAELDAKTYAKAGNHKGPVSCGRGLYQPTETDRKWKSRPRRPSESAPH